MKLKISKLKITTLSFAIIVLCGAVFTLPVSAFVSTTTTWFTISDTRVTATAVGDINNDGLNELVTAGYFNDGNHWNAQLVVYNPATMAVIAYRAWTTVSDTQLTAVAIGDVNNDGINEIVTGGAFFDGTRWNAELAVWNGATVAVTLYKSWFTVANTEISSIAIGNIDGIAGNEIVTGLSFFDGTIWHAELVVLNGATLAVNAFRTWTTVSSTTLNAVAIGDVNNDGLNEVVTGSSFVNGALTYAELAVWTGSAMVVTTYRFWTTIGNTILNAIVVGNVDGVAGNEVVTGGSFFDGTRWNSELAVWSGATMTVSTYRSWFTTSNTKINAIAIGQYNAGPSMDIFTVGVNNDGTRDNAQFFDWSGAGLNVYFSTSWFQAGATEANSVAFGSVSAANHVFTVGSYFSSNVQNAQVITWT